MQMITQAKQRVNRNYTCFLAFNLCIHFYILSYLVATVSTRSLVSV